MSSNKYAVVTGASTGIGRAVAIQLGKQGCTVFLVARSKNKLEKTKIFVEKAGGSAEVIVADLSDVNSVKEIKQEVEKVTKELKYIFNIAGVWHGDDEVYAGKDYDAFSEKVILDTFNVGLISPALISHALIPLMPKGSSIINLSGTFENGAKGWLPYFVSKRGIEDLTVGLSEELKEKGINVNCVSPSDTATEEYGKYFPEYAKDAQTPEEVAEIIVEQSQKNVTGQVIVVKNGVQENKFHG